MLDILVAGRDRSDLMMVEEMLRHHSAVAVRKRQLLNGSSDPLADIDRMPDLLILFIHASSDEELAALGHRSPAERPNVLVVGPADNPQLMRKAMRAGARDFLLQPLQKEELILAVDRAAEEHQSLQVDAQRRFIVVVNAKGGAGASVLASNAADIFASHFNVKTALVDMDLQFGQLALNFDKVANDGLLQALESIDTLDTVALEGWAIKHESGVHLFGSTHKDMVLSSSIPEERLRRLFDLLARNYEQVVIDLPRQIDHLFATTINRADRVLVVMQQGLASLRDGKTLMSILKRELLVPSERITLVVNRYAKTEAITLRDFERALPGINIVTIPNDYQQVMQSLNTGVPLYEFAARAQITRDLIGLVGDVSGRVQVKKGFFQRLWGTEARRT